MNSTDALSDFLAHRIPHAYMIETSPEDAGTPETADSLGVVRECLVKAAVVNADDRLVTAVIPAARELSLEKLRRYLGAAHVRPALDADLAQLTSCGGIASIPIFGSSCGVRVLVPHELVEFQEITFLVGPSQVIVRINLFEFLVDEKPDICARNAILTCQDGADRCDGMIVFRLDERTYARELVGVLPERRKTDRGNNVVGMLRLARKKYGSEAAGSETIVIDDHA